MYKHERSDIQNEIDRTRLTLVFARVDHILLLVAANAGPQHAKGRATPEFLTRPARLARGAGHHDGLLEHRRVRWGVQPWAATNKNADLNVLYTDLAVPQLRGITKIQEQRCYRLR